MAKQKINIQGLSITIESINENNFVSLTDMAKGGDTEVSEVIRRWLRAPKTIDVLLVWEKLHNPDFNLAAGHQIKINASREIYGLSVKKWIETTKAIGIEARPGRYGGTYVHQDLALHFANWLSPEFYVYLIKEFQILKEAEFQQKNLQWHLSKITNNIDEVRNLLDSIPHQDPKLKRIK